MAKVSALINGQIKEFNVWRGEPQITKGYGDALVQAYTRFPSSSDLGHGENK
jgi:hypothetical protein